MINRTQRSTNGSTDHATNDATVHTTVTQVLAEIESAHVPHDPDSATAWMAEGNCRLHPPSTFFPSDGVGVDRARKICASCPVISTCLEFALDKRIDHGVWGGCSERERRRILKRRRAEIGD